MKKEDAKKLILTAFPRWWGRTRGEREEATGDNAIVFCGYLQQEKPHLLNFRAVSSKEKLIHGWLLHARLVPD